MKNKRIDSHSTYFRTLMVIGGIILFILLWEILHLLVAKVVIPDPLSTFQDMFIKLGEWKTYEALFHSLYRILISLAISSLCGIILGTIGGQNEWFDLLLKPLITILRNLPTSAIILLLVIYLTPNQSPIVVVFLVTFPIMYESTLGGVQNINQSYIDALKIDGGIHNTNAIFKVIVPLSMPYILVGLLSSLGLSMKVEVMAEILTGITTGKGIGYLIFVSYYNVQVKEIFSYSLILIIVTSLIEYCLRKAKSLIKY